jgi:hypothetical protein
MMHDVGSRFTPAEKSPNPVASSPRKKDLNPKKHKEEGYKKKKNREEIFF